MSSDAVSVLFDLDDTLFDLRHASRAGLVAIQAASAALRRATLDELESVYRALLEELHARVLEGSVTLQEARLERFCRLFAHHGHPVSPKVARDASHVYQEAYRAARQPTAGAIPLLRALRAHSRIAVVSNNFLAEQQEKLAVCGLAELVDALVVSEVVGVPKPHPAMFNAALAAVRSQPRRAVMVGDSWESDILGAQGAGVRAVWLNRFGVPCPDPTLATEVASLEPTQDLVALLLGVETSASP